MAALTAALGDTVAEETGDTEAEEQIAEIHDTDVVDDVHDVLGIRLGSHHGGRDDGDEETNTGEDAVGDQKPL